MGETVYYAIGDIHGEASRLRRMHNTIHAMHAERFGEFGKTVIHLGDYVDRGPDSYDVIETIIALEKQPDISVISLKGNHEQLMLDACLKVDQHAWRCWLKNGGDDTLSSYQQRNFTTPPVYHLDWLRARASMHWDKSAKLIFVHAGIDPHKFPLGDDRIKLWTRARSFFDTTCWSSPELDGMRVVHGHTPTKNDKPEISEDRRRINIDTGACYGGPLTAVVIAPGQDPSFLLV